MCSLDKESIKYNGIVLLMGKLLVTFSSLNLFTISLESIVTAQKPYAETVSFKAYELNF